MSHCSAILKYYGIEESLLDIHTAGMLNQTPQAFLKIQALCAGIDSLLQQQLKAILHHPQLQALEASWRGLGLLIQALPERISSVKLKILNLSYEELEKDVHETEFEQSRLFSLLYSQEFDQAGGEPYGLLIADFAPQSSLDIFKALAKIAASAFTPIVLAAHSNSLNLNQYKTLEYASFRKDPDARFLGLCFGRILMRIPKAWEGAHFLWGESHYLYAVVILQAYLNTGWFQNLNLPLSTQESGINLRLKRAPSPLDPGTLLSKSVFELRLTKMQVRALAEQGILAAYDRPWKESLSFQEHPSLYKKSESPSKKQSENLSTTLCISRFAHYLKIMLRDKLSGFVQAEECERYLQHWIQAYCARNNPNSPQLDPKFPLQEARIKIDTQGYLSGKNTCSVDLKLQPSLMQLESDSELQARIKL